MYKTIGMVAHVDAGKTTLLEQILYHTHTIREAGRVDNKNTFLDYHTIEKERGITVFSDQALTTYNDCTYQLVDTPGHVDFSAEMERAIRILDYAVIILSAVEGIEGHTETVWQLLKKHKIPTFFFINKLDRIGADFNRVATEIKDTFTEDLLVISPLADSQNNDYLLENPTTAIVEFIAERDDTIMEKYIDDIQLEPKEIIEAIKRLMTQNRLYPCLCGSALQSKGIHAFLQALDTLTIPWNPNKENGSLSGRVYKIRYDNEGNKLTFIKLFSGTLKVKDTICHTLANGEEMIEKINQIRIYNGTKYTLTNRAYTGQLIAVTGLHQSYIGEGIGNQGDDHDFLLVPTLQAKVIYKETSNPKEILKIFTTLTEEDPSLDVVWNEALKEIHIKVMGTIQLEVLNHIVWERFGEKITFGTPEILYKETITSKTHGFGHFEPLKHYAEVEFDIKPAPRNSGIAFNSTCSVDILHTRWQRLSEKNIPDACKRGMLTGSPLTDIQITLTAGKSHVKHTSGGDFRQATFRAIRQGIERVDNILLEPYYRFKIKVANELSGRVMTDITKMHGHFDAPTMKNQHVVITGHVPVATSMNYPSELASFTSGKGSITFVFAGYEACHNTYEVVERLGYNKDGDKDYTSTSIFCSHGKAYSVKGCDIAN